MRFDTHRLLEDGQQVGGIRRPIFIHWGDWGGDVYRLVDLRIFADGLIEIPNRRSNHLKLDFDGFCEKVRSGLVAAQIPDGARVFHDDLGTWRMSGTALIGEDDLIADVKDTIARFQGIPTSGHRLSDAIDAYLADRSEQKRMKLRDAYLAVPTHHRRFQLGDMDMKDWPLRVLTGEIGEMLTQPLPPYEDGPVTPEAKEWALQYLEERSRLRHRPDAGVRPPASE